MLRGRVVSYAVLGLTRRIDINHRRIVALFQGRGDIL